MRLPTLLAAAHFNCINAISKSLSLHLTKMIVCFLHMKVAENRSHDFNKLVKNKHTLFFKELNSIHLAECLFLHCPFLFFEFSVAVNSSVGSFVRYLLKPTLVGIQTGHLRTAQLGPPLRSENALFFLFPFLDFHQFFTSRHSS